MNHPVEPYEIVNDKYVEELEAQLVSFNVLVKQKLK
jgi:hypothetical protein